MQPTFDASPKERLRSATNALKDCLSRFDGPRALPNVAEEADICLGVRTAFNAFVDFNAWYRLWGGEDIAASAEELSTLFGKSALILQKNKLQKTHLYLKSVEEKTQFLAELRRGKTLYELTAHAHVSQSASDS